MNKRFFFLVLMVTSLTSCSTIAPKQPTEKEINAEAKKAYDEFKSKAKISQNKEWNEMIRRVGERVTKATGENFEWEFVLVENEEHNAWCMPGGKIAFYTGIMPVLKTEAAVAAVMGHEIAHATRRHGLKGYSRAIQENRAGIAVGLASIVGSELLCKTEACKTLTKIGGATAALGITFFSRKFSRTDETEADTYGLEYMAKAGYDPSESIKVWERMSASGGAKVPEWMSTHPSDSNRIKNLSGHMDKAKKLYENTPVKYGVGERIN